MHTYMHACIHAYIHAYMHTCIHAYMHTCIHTYIHSYIHTFIHSYIHSLHAKNSQKNKYKLTYSTHVFTDVRVYMLYIVQP